jgi:hypothetical protein
MELFPWRPKLGYIDGGQTNLRSEASENMPYCCTFYLALSKQKPSPQGNYE